ncbi:MAG: tRNA (cytidine(34)-2'-O)-methyltransferase [Chlamydiia bacterium]|nr:tRNA (cytidine(34)-2'-O)-methyltransferase [Chlamydiia bacterium]MCH9616514.1 tRNA (cytidine(34)-2'-O)-methyltransferase [Chlamydiia bacterium]MCH9629500.1 tRNA (cytidine(34)-2'-O)-methyltransferase [Chlamydiia bacterium]
MIIVLHEPQIPQNTGAIVRTCSVTGTSLVLVRPLAFELTDKWLKRAGLDYWKNVDITEIDSLDQHLESNPDFYLFTSKADRPYSDVSYKDTTSLVFGSETTGLPEHYLEKYRDRCVTIPMKREGRCLNLSNAANIGLYEGLRQNNFTALV